MQVFRADEAGAAQFMKILARRGLSARIEHYPFGAAYVVVAADDPEIMVLARSVGRNIRRVPSFDELAAPGR